jgi:hypothetical protein
LREFDAQLQKGGNSGAWTCVVTGAVPELFGTRGLVKIRGCDRWRGVRGRANGARRRHTQAPGQGGAAEDHRQGGGRHRPRPDRRADRLAAIRRLGLPRLAGVRALIHRCMLRRSESHAAWSGAADPAAMSWGIGALRRRCAPLSHVCLPPHRLGRSTGDDTDHDARLFRRSMSKPVIRLYWVAISSSSWWVMTSPSSLNPSGARSSTRS